MRHTDAVRCCRDCAAYRHSLVLRDCVCGIQMQSGAADYVWHTDAVSAACACSLSSPPSLGFALWYQAVTVMC